MRDAEIPTATQSPRPTALIRTRDEVARLGKAIYERDIRPQIEADHYGEVVAIDVDSGKWAIGEEVLEAVDCLRTQQPEAVNVLLERIGYQALDNLGGRFCEDPVIQGVVNAAYEPVLTLVLQSSSGQDREVEAVVDTGFNGYLTLPPGLVVDLGLPLIGIGSGVLADGSEVSFDIHYCAVLWDGRQRFVRVNVSDTTPLVGMRLLDRHSLYVEIEDGGRVVIQARE